MKQFAGILMLLFLTILSYGVELKLKNGTVSKGTLLVEDRKFFTIQTDSGKLKILKASIVAIDGRTYSSVPSRPQQPSVRPLSGGALEQDTAIASVEQSSGELREWVILLKNGSVIKGKPKSQNQRVLVLESKNIPVTVFKNVIVSIDSTGGVPSPQGGAASGIATGLQPPVSSGNNPEKPVTPPVTSAVGNGSNQAAPVVQPYRRGVSPPVTLDAKVVSSVSGDIPQSAPSVPVAPRKLKTNVVAMSADNRSDSGRIESPVVAPKSEATTNDEPVALPSPGALPLPKSRVNVVAVSKEQPVSDGRTGEVVPVQENAAVIVAAGTRETSRTTDSLNSNTISLIPPRTSGMGVSRNRDTSAKQGMPIVTTDNATKVPSVALTPSSSPPVIAASTTPPAYQTGREATAESTPAIPLPLPIPPGAAMQPRQPPSSGAAQSAQSGMPAVQKVPPLSVKTAVPAGQMPAASPPPSAVPGRTPQNQTITVSPVPPMDTSSVSTVRQPRTDGKKELVMMDSTVFIGTILSETDHVIVFASEGASLTILKNLIKAIDGEPYAFVKNAQKGPFASSAAVSSRETANKKKTPPHALFRVIPAEPFPDGITVEILADSIRSTNDWKARARAARYAGAMGPWGVALVPEIAKLLADTVQSAVAIPEWIDSTTVNQLLAPGLEAARALAQLGAQGEVELLAALKHPEPMRRRFAVFGLGNCFLESADKAVKGVLKDADPTVRMVALGSLRANSSLLLLLEALKDADPGVRGSAVYLLGKLGERTAVEHLELLIKDHKAEVRRLVAAALGNIAADETVPPLMLLCKDIDHFVRAEAVRALGRTKAGNAAAPLLEALNDPSKDVRAGAVEALGILRDSRCIPSLYAALKDKDRTVREKAAIALKNLTDLPSLISALDDESTAVRANTSYVLWLTTGQDFGQDREKWETWAATAEKKKSGSKSENATR